MDEERNDDRDEDSGLRNRSRGYGLRISLPILPNSVRRFVIWIFVSLLFPLKILICASL